MWYEMHCSIKNKLKNYFEHKLPCPLPKWFQNRVIPRISAIHNQSRGMCRMPCSCPCPAKNSLVEEQSFPIPWISKKGVEPRHFHSAILRTQTRGWWVTLVTRKHNLVVGPMLGSRLTLFAHGITQFTDARSDDVNMALLRLVNVGKFMHCRVFHIDLESFFFSYGRLSFYMWSMWILLGKFMHWIIIYGNCDFMESTVNFDGNILYYNTVL